MVAASGGFDFCSHASHISLFLKKTILSHLRLPIIFALIRLKPFGNSASPRCSPPPESISTIDQLQRGLYVPLTYFKEGLHV